MSGERILMPKSLAFAKRIVFAYRYLSEEKEYVLSKQILRSGTSIGANIAEAQYGSSRRDFLNKLYIALKELRRLSIGWNCSIPVATFPALNMTPSIQTAKN